MDIIETILDFILKLIPRRKEKEIPIVVDDDYIGNLFNEKAFREAVNFLKRNSYAYQRGKNVSWKSGRINNKSYNSILACKVGNGYYKVYRHYSPAGYKQIKVKKIVRAAFNELTARGYYQTYCNIAVGIFTMKYGLGNIQFFEGTEYDANSLIKSLKAGVFNVNGFEFVKTPIGDAVEYARQGGLVVNCWENKGGIGHVSVMTGNYSSDDNPEIFQAGLHFGKMSMVKGFGEIDDEETETIEGRIIEHYRLEKV